MTTEPRVIVSTAGLSALCALQGWSADGSEALVRFDKTIYRFPREAVIDVSSKNVANMLVPAGHG